MELDDARHVERAGHDPQAHPRAHGHRARARASSSTEQRRRDRAAEGRSQRSKARGSDAEFEAYLERLRGTLELGMSTDEIHGAAARRMSDTLVDTNVLIDVLDDDPDLGRLVERAARRGRGSRRPRHQSAHLRGGLRRLSDAACRPIGAMSSAIYRRENLPWEAAFNAGQAFIAYRRARRSRSAHRCRISTSARTPTCEATSLLTRDPRRYRQLLSRRSKIIAPDTHP